MTEVHIQETRSESQAPPLTSFKCVVIIAEQLPVWLSINTAAVLMLSLGSHVPFLLGEDVADGSGQMHPGITRVPIPILQAPKKTIGAIWTQTKAIDELHVLDFTTIAQASKIYQEYTFQMNNALSHELEYLGIVLYGEKRMITKLTKHLPLFSYSGDQKDVSPDSSGVRAER